MNVQKKELKYIIISIAFAITYFFFVLPHLMKNFNGNDPILQFFIFNLGLLIFFTIYLKSRTLGRRINLMKSIEYLTIVLAIDIWIPEYHVGIFTGELLHGSLLGLAATDYFFGYIGHNFLHLSGIFVSIWTYIIAPLFLLYIAAKISKSNFVRNV